MSIDSIVNLVACRIGELLIQEAKLLYGVEDQVRNLQGELRMMNAFLNDMEAMDEEGGDERARNTIQEIRRIAYDAEDVIESYLLQFNSSANKMEGFLRRYVCFYSSLVFTHQVGSEIEAIKVRIAETMGRWRNYLSEIGIGIDAREGLKVTRMRRPIAYSHNSEDHVVGLEENINKLVAELTMDETRIKVVSIVGMGGCGKTTLARKVYNHESVKQCFDCMAWISISRQWVAQHVLLDLLKRASGETMKLDEVWGPQVVADKLHRYLEQRKYLIVLDDVWTKQALEEILPALPMGNDGSKIMVTTRFREVIDYPNLKSSIHEPRELNAEESWELFRKIALSHKEDTRISSMEFVALEALGKEMLKKCKGLPLAVVALAGLLAKKETLEEWEKVNKAVSSRVMETGRGTHLYGAVKEMLALSYNDLPRDLKPCFLYLGLFPEDSEIPTGLLIRMWIAEGFISSNNVHEGETLEDVARDYLDELIDRCVVRVASRNYEGKVKKIEIHDLIRDLCNKKAKEQDFLEILSARSSNQDTRATQPRRTIIHSYDRMYFPFSSENSHLRSLFLFARANVGILKWHTGEDRPKLSSQPILKNFKLLRVLNIVGVDTSDGILPREIGGLIHLRYFGLRVTNIWKLPSSIGNLRNLLTLDYRGLEDFSKQVKIPDVFWKMEGLRHLYLPLRRSAMEKLKVHTLKHLQTLWVGGGNWMLEELPNLSESVQKLHIEGITCMEQLEVAFRCPSMMLDRLHALYIDWLTECEGGMGLRNLEHIVNSRHLKKLALRGRIDDKFTGFQFPLSIKYLRLWFTQLEAEETLGALGRLPNLKVLDLSRDSYIGTKWTCSEGMFSQLKELMILDLPNLVEWSIERGAMCQLEKLTIWQCMSLTRLPDGLKFITTLKVLKLEYMTEEFYSRIRGEDGEDAHIVQHIPNVTTGMTLEEFHSRTREEDGEM